jgi:hypothetical protein
MTSDIFASSIFKLGSAVRDKATGATGTLTHVCIGLDYRTQYAFQPKGLNPETGQPIRGIWISPQRIVTFGKPEASQVPLPLHVLGTKVEDTASGFNGMAISLTLHTNGCVHVEVQPSGCVRSSNATIDPLDVDIRRLTGPAIKKMNDEELEADQKARPSPMSCPPRSRPV